MTPSRPGVVGMIRDRDVIARTDIPIVRIPVTRGDGLVPRVFAYRAGRRVPDCRRADRIDRVVNDDDDDSQGKRQ